MAGRLDTGHAVGHPRRGYDDVPRQARPGLVESGDVAGVEDVFEGVETLVPDAIAELSPVGPHQERLLRRQPAGAPNPGYPVRPGLGGAGHRQRRR